MIQEHLLSSVDKKPQLCYSVVWAKGVTPSAGYEDRVDLLVESIMRGDSEGKPGILQSRLSDGRKVFSRNINKGHRIVYSFDYDNKQIIIHQAEGHYAD